MHPLGGIDDADADDPDADPDPDPEPRPSDDGADECCFFSR
jgi:hypothetical protein